MKTKKEDFSAEKLCELPKDKKIAEVKKRITEGYYKSDFVTEDIAGKMINLLSKLS